VPEHLKSELEEHEQLLSEKIREFEEKFGEVPENIEDWEDTNSNQVYIKSYYP